MTNNPPTLTLWLLFWNHTSFMDCAGSLSQQWIIQRFLSVSSFFYLHIPLLPLPLFSPLLVHRNCPSSSASCSSEGRWNHRMMTLSVSAPVLASHPSGASVLGGRCPRARQDLWDFPETPYHGTCPNTRGGSGRVRTPSLTRQRGPWFVSQVRESISVFRDKPRLSPNCSSNVGLKWWMEKCDQAFRPISAIRSMCIKSFGFCELDISLGRRLL